MELRKLLALVLAVCMSISLLAGCSKGKETSNDADKTTDATTEESSETKEDDATDQKETETGEESSEEDGGMVWDDAAKMYKIEEEVLNGSASLKLWVDNDQFAQAVKSGFEAKYPGVVLEVEVVASTESVDKMALEGEAGTGADVFVIPHDTVGDAMNSTVIGMMGKYDDIIRDRFIDSAVSTIDFEGNLFGVPFLTESVALIYNKTLLQKLNADGLVASAEPAADMNDIKTLAAKYNDPANNVWTIRWEAGNAYVNHMFVTSNGYELFGSDGIDPDAANFDSENIINGLTYFQSFRNSWNVNTGDTTWDTTVVEFAKGQTPYLITGPWALETVAQGGVDNGYEFGVVPLPKFDGKQPYSFSGVQVACVSSYTKYPAAARALAMYIGSDEMLSFLYGTLKKLPALKDGSSIAGLSEDLNVKAFMAQAGFSKAMPSIPEISYFWSVAGSMYSSVWDGTATPADAAKKAQEDYEALRVSGQ